tara:strand:- start:405 stop:602 length:198 start_codon:yes stop_codon:yes gene_type:complete
MELRSRIMDFGGRSVFVLTDTSPDSAPDLAHMSKSSLIGLAEERGIEVTTRMTKAALVEAIEGAS